MKRLIIYHDPDCDPVDVDSLWNTVKIVLPGGEIDVMSSDAFDHNTVHPDDVLVGCGKKACESLLDRSVKVTSEAGTTHTFTVEPPGGEMKAYRLVVQLGPAYIRHQQNDMKGGSAEKAVRLWLDVWQQVADTCNGKDVKPPHTHILSNKQKIIETLNRLLSNDIKEVGYDYETWGDVNALRPELNNVFKIVSIGVSWITGGKISAASFLLDRPGPADKDIERLWLRVLREKQGVCHFGRYEMKCNIKRFGVHVSCRDTILQTHALDELADGGLDRIMVRCGLNWGSFKTQFHETRIRPMEAQIPELLRYNGLDAWATLYCYLHQEDELLRNGLAKVCRMDEEFSFYLARQEMTGLAVSRPQIAFMRKKIAKTAASTMETLRKDPRIQRVETWAQANIKSCKKGAIFNPKSHPMMARLVIDELKIKPPTKKKKGKETMTFNSEALEGLAEKYPLLGSINTYRSDCSMDVFLGKWGLFIGPTGAVHTSYNQTIVVTGRLSSTNPPLQNIPKDHEIRTVFRSRFPRGLLINADYAQQEPRLMAGWSGDKKMIEAINGGLDLHSFVAAEIYGVPYESVKKESKEREVGKRMNLGIAYGQTEFGLSEKTKISIDAARDIIRRYDDRFKDITKWRLGNHKMAMMYGYVEDLFGARRHLPDAQTSDKWKKERALRQAGNFPIQGTAYRFTQIAVGTLIELFDEHLPGQAYVVGQVHDSIVVDCMEEVADVALGLVEQAMLVHNEMDYWKDRGCPMKVDLKIGRDLYHMQKVA